MQFQFCFPVVAFITVAITSGTFVTLRKLAVDVFLLAWNNGHICIKFCICGLLKTSFENIKVLLKSDKINRYFTRRSMKLHNNTSPKAS
jgi:hypothetical protein